MIWTWNGHEFVFLTDVLGIAPLGATSGDGSYFPVDHDEYVQLPSSALVEKDGALEIRMTEEFSEVSYIDQLQLFALDHRKTKRSSSMKSGSRRRSPSFVSTPLATASIRAKLSTVPGTMSCRSC